MSDDYLDIDDVLFGASDPPADGSFDPFLPGLGQDDTEGDGRYGGADDSEPSDGADGVIRYGRFGGQSHSGQQPDDDEPLPWAGGTDQPARGIEEQRDREAADAGNRQLRRVANERGRSPGTGTVGRERTESVEGGIAAAQQRIGRLASVPITPNDERALAIGAREHRDGVQYKPKREYQKQHILTPPQFQQCEFEATLQGLKSNTAGNWMLQLIVPPSDANAVFQLKDGYGLALKVTVVRKPFSDGAS